MRNGLLLGVAGFTLAACGGGSGAGPETVGSVAPVVGGGTSGGSVYDQFVRPTEARTYVGVGASHNFQYDTDSSDCCVEQTKPIYAGNATTVRSSSISISYDPRDAIFTLTVQDPLSGTASNTRYQDPASRTDFGGAVQPQWGTPDLSRAPAAYANPNIRYLQSGGGNPASPYMASGNGLVYYGSPDVAPSGDAGAAYESHTFFYEKPGSSTKYVTLAGFISNSLTFSEEDIDSDGTDDEITSWDLTRGAFAYGMLTDNSNVPTTGTASFNGNMLATMVFNPTLDSSNPAPTYFQWLTGSSRVDVNFATKAVTMGMQGVVLNPQLDRDTTPRITVPAGSTFTASGSATIDLVGKGGFTGSFANGSFTFTRPDGAKAPVAIAGSSIDGAFYGPGAEEVGGGFRVVGGTPDERIDILGAFTGKK